MTRDTPPTKQPPREGIGYLTLRSFLISLRADQRLTALSEQTGRAKSYLLREAIDALLARHEVAE